MKKSNLRKIIQKETKSILENGFGHFEWDYFYLKNGRLVDENGKEVNKNFPNFKSTEEAEEFLEKENIRGNVKGNYNESRYIKKSELKSIIKEEIKKLKEEQMVTLRSIDKDNKKTYTGIMEENVNVMSIKTVLDKNNIPYQKIKKESNDEFVIVSGFKGLKYGPRWSEYEDKVYSSLERAGWKGEEDKTSIYID